MAKEAGAVNAENIIEEFKAGNELALAYLYDHYSRALFGVGLRILNDPTLTEDLLQESFVKIWENREKFDESKASLYTWMLNICRNKAIDKLRSRGHKNQQQNRLLDKHVYNLKSKYTQDPQHIGLNELVEKLPAEQSEIIQLSFFEGYTQKEIAEECGIPLGTVKSRARAALQKLKKYFNR